MFIDDNFTLYRVLALFFKSFIGRFISKEHSQVANIPLFNGFVKHNHVNLPCICRIYFKHDHLIVGTEAGISHDVLQNRQF